MTAEEPGSDGFSPAVSRYRYRPDGARAGPGILEQPGPAPQATSSTGPLRQVALPSFDLLCSPFSR